MSADPLELPSSTQLRRFFTRLDCHFQRAEPREHAYAYLCGLLSHTPPVPTPREDGRHRLLTTARWSEDAVRDEVRCIVGERLAASGSVFVLAEEAFVKKGDNSAGVARQFSSSAGKVENAQLGVFLLQANAAGSAGVIDRELYLPACWTEDPARRERAGIPGGLASRSRRDLALGMLDRTRAAGAPAHWVTAVDPSYGDDGAFRAALERRRLPYVLPSSHPARPIPASPVAEDFARCHVSRWGGGSYLCFVPHGTDTEEISLVASQGGAAARTLTTARSDAGLERYSVRKWRAWYRHMTLAMSAQVFLLVSEQRPAKASRLSLAEPSPRPVESAELSCITAEGTVAYCS
ncbi:IS701 family transposase [Streptomyces profundus]|uniref:IS701 family transposase n=1 Tax=Streptomyces profundus TaxID=2867410 RepID=UPI001D16DDB6|nr:transposase [Streptomyces sp. MA3_2.13]UED83230.1 transposase [Streptomyces sp. MA3_2.13]